MKPREFEAKLRKEGWKLKGARGHHVWTSPSGRRLEVRRGGRWAEVPPYLILAAERERARRRAA
jgi:hypothetical protein